MFCRVLGEFPSQPCAKPSQPCMWKSFWQS